MRIYAIFINLASVVSKTCQKTAEDELRALTEQSPCTSLWQCFHVSGNESKNNDQHLYKIKLKMPNDKSDLLLQMLTVIFHLLGNSVIWFKWTKNRSGAEGGLGWHRPIHITERVRSVLCSCCTFSDQWSPDWKCSLLISSMITKKTCRCFPATFTISYWLVELK